MRGLLAEWAERTALKVAFSVTCQNEERGRRNKSEEAGRSLSCHDSKLQRRRSVCSGFAPLIGFTYSGARACTVLGDQANTHRNIGVFVVGGYIRFAPLSICLKALNTK